MTAAAERAPGHAEPRRPVLPLRAPPTGGALTSMVHLRRRGIEAAPWVPQPTRWEGQGLGPPPLATKRTLLPPRRPGWAGGAVTRTSPEATLTPLTSCADMANDLPPPGFRSLPGGPGIPPGPSGDCGG